MSMYSGCHCRRKGKIRPERPTRRPECGGHHFDLPVRHAPPLESSFANQLLTIQDGDEKVVFTISCTRRRELATASGHRVIGSSDHRNPGLCFSITRWPDHPMTRSIQVVF